MARDLRIVGAGVHRPDERSVREEDRVGPSVVVYVSSEDLKSRPVHTLRLTEDQAIALLAKLADAIAIMRRHP